MQKRTRNILLFFSPFLIMILINEIVRPTIKEKPFEKFGIQAINSNLAFKEKCSWRCYQYTSAHCKKHHVKILHTYFEYVDPIYFGIINSLHLTGNYGLANVLILVLLLPFLMFFLLVKNLDLYSQIKTLKSKS